MESKAGKYIHLMHSLISYEKSPYMTLNKLKRKTIKKLKPRQLNCEEVVDYDKPHSFKTHNFKGLNWCELCGNFLWGFTQQGVKCEGMLMFRFSIFFNIIKIIFYNYLRLRFQCTF